MKFLKTLALFLKFKVEELCGPVTGFIGFFLFCWGDKWFVCDYLRLPVIDAIILPVLIVGWVMAVVWAKDAFLFVRDCCDYDNHGDAQDWIPVCGIYTGFLGSVISLPFTSTLIAMENEAVEPVVAIPVMVGILCGFTVAMLLAIIYICCAVAVGVWSFLRSNWQRAKDEVERRQHETQDPS